MKLFKSFLLLILFGYLLTDLSLSAETNKKYPQKIVPSETLVSYINRIKQGFNIQVWINNQMIMGGATGAGIGLEYPANSGVEHLYSLVPYIGVMVDGRIAVCEGFNGYDPLISSLPQINYYYPDFFWRTVIGECQYDSLGYRGYYYNNRIITNQRYINDDYDGKIDEDELDGIDNDGDWNIITDDVGEDGLPDYFEISCDGVPYDSVSNTDPADDNFNPTEYDSCHPGYSGYQLKNNRDVYTEKNGLPNHGEPHVDEDYGAISNNDIYCSATDTFRRPMFPTTNYTGAKLFLKSYSWLDTPNDEFILFEYNFINLGRKPWNDVYVGFFADMDVGPISVENFNEHNYASFDSVTKTVYIHNPIDSGTTPLGLSLIQLANRSDSSKLIFQWWDYQHSLSNNIGGNDSLSYVALSGQALSGNYVMPNQDPDSLSDSRALLSFGPFNQIKQNDTARAIIALVSGRDINSMLDNAMVAKSIYENNYLLGINRIVDIFPREIVLSQNYPNPFNPTTDLRFKIADFGFVSLKVYNLLGQEVATLVNEQMKPGSYKVTWDASQMSSGVYFYRLQSGKFTDVKKMVLMR